MKEYRKRIADEILKKRLESKGAVLVEGAKWCGKTTTSLQHAKSVLYMQNPATVKQNLEMAEINPLGLLSGEAPRLIDEWQLAPKLWDAVRFEVDQRDEFGQFILTGSAVPADMSSTSHTGIGRIARLTMRPMSLFESGESNGNVSLKELFQGNVSIQGATSTSLEEIAFWICRFLFDAQAFPVFIKLCHSISLGIINIISKDRCFVLILCHVYTVSQEPAESCTIEYIIT